MKKQLLGFTLALALTGGAFAAVTPSQIPADAKGVVSIQMKALMDSPFLKAAETKLPPGALNADESSPVGPKEIKEATAFFNEKWAGVLVEAPGKGPAIIKELEKESSKKTVAGKSVYFANGEPFAAIQLSADELLFVGVYDEGEKAIEGAVAYLLNPKTPRLAATSPLAAVLKAKPGRYLFGAMTDCKTLLTTEPFKDMPENMPGIEHVQRIVFSLIDAPQSGISLTTKLVSDTAEHGSQLQETLLGVKAMMGLAAAQMPALNPVIKSFSVKQNTTVTDASITLRVSDIEAIMGAMLPMMMGGGDLEMTISDEDFSIN